MAVQPMPKLQGQGKSLKVKASPKRNKKAPEIPSAATFLKASCEGVKRLGGIHVPEVRGGQGNKYKLGVALNRYASQQAELSRAAAGGPLQTLPPQALVLGRKPPQPQPVRQAAAVRGRPPASAQAKAAGQGGAPLPAPAPRTVRKRRRRQVKRRRKAALPKAGPEAGAEAVAAAGDAGAATSGQTRKPGAARQQPAAAGAAAAAAARRQSAASLEALRMRRLPPGLQVGAGRTASPVPWRL